MGNKIRTVLTSLLLVGWVTALAVAVPSYSEGAPSSDPFAALQVNRMASDSPITPFDLKNLDGRTIGSDELQGKVILVNFWATWCGPCKEEMPSLARLQSQFDPGQFQVVTITTDRYPQGIKQFFDRLGIQLPVLFDEQEDVSRSFMVRGLPTTVLIATDGRAVGRAVGPRAWDSEESVSLVRHILAGMK